MLHVHLSCEGMLKNRRQKDKHALHHQVHAGNACVCTCREKHLPHLTIETLHRTRNQVDDSFPRETLAQTEHEKYLLE